MKQTRKNNIHLCQHGTTQGRRRFLRLCAGGAAGLVLPAAWARRPARELAFYNTHTGESVKATFWAQGRYVKEGLRDINRLLRDHRTDDVFPMDPQLLDLLYRLQASVDCHKPLHVISGYRSPKTNQNLRRSSRGVAKRSLHTRGMAIDIRLPGCELSRLRQAALALQSGGVGYYPKSDFIHVDTGRVRFW